MKFSYKKNLYAIAVMVMISLTTLPTQATEREDWIAAEKLLWNYAPSGRNLIHPDSGLDV
jgi:hypothetical protein